MSRSKYVEPTFRVIPKSLTSSVRASRSVFIKLTNPRFSSLLALPSSPRPGNVTHQPGSSVTYQPGSTRCWALAYTVVFDRGQRDGNSTKALRKTYPRYLALMTFALSFSKRLDGRSFILDELKGFAILLVVLYHAGGVLAWNNRLHGELGVDIFVLLSGAGLALSSSSLSTGAFLRRRLLRIFPAYWLILTFVLVMNSKLLGLAYTSKDIALHYAGIHAFFGDQYALSINDSFWYVTLIVLTYGLFLLGRRWLLEPGKLVLFGSIVTATLTYAFLTTGQAGCYSHFALRLPLFFVGIVWGTALHNGRLEIAPTASLGLGLFLLSYVAYTQGVIFSGLIVAPGLMAGYAFAWKRLVPAAVDQFSGRILRFLGEHSYEIFLMHQPIIRHYNIHFLGLWLKRSPDENETIFGMILTFLVTIVLSVLLRQLQLRIFKPRVSPGSPKGDTQGIAS